MRLISVITPLHEPGNRTVEQTWTSLLQQSADAPQWEWIVVENNGGHLPANIRTDPRVCILTSQSGSIGLLKRVGCEVSRGGVVVELDADDLLAPTALRRIADAFTADPAADFVYSDFAEFLDATGEPAVPYNARYGWEHYPVWRGGRELLAMRAPDATPHNVRFVDWAPNHVRAWRAASYWKVGGHNDRMDVGDDHDLIVRMLLAGSKFVRVPECLYFYRVHPDNTVAKKNAAIRSATTAVYNRTVWALAEKWTASQGLRRIDLCGGIDPPPGYTPIDRRVPPGSGGVECDLDGRWALEDSSVGVLRAHDAVEHLKDPVHAMNEAYRVLAPGGWLMISVPSTNGLGAFCDPTHRSFWNRLSFRYYTDPKFARYVPEFCGRFQVSRVIEWFPDDWHRENNVPYVEAHLICCKDGFRAMGEYLW